MMRCVGGGIGGKEPAGTLVVSPQSFESLGELVLDQAAHFRGNPHQFLEVGLQRS
jgi:hypothetical protein